METGEIDRDLRPRKSRAKQHTDSHRSPEGTLGEGAAGQARRPIPQGDGSRTRRPQKHRPQVRFGRKSTTQEEERSNRNATDSEGCIYMNRHFRWTSTQDQENPFAESFNGRLRDECLRIDWFMSLSHASLSELGIADPQPQFHLTLHNVEQQSPCTRPFSLI